MELINKYFPELTSLQSERLNKLLELYSYWNEKINVISRKDMHNFYLKHVLHSLSITKTISFKNGSRVLDIGSGGGFPGIPLAIMHNKTSFFLVDSIGKKTMVMSEIIKELNLNNVHAIKTRAEDFHEYYNHVCCRAVAPLSKLVHWINLSRKRGGGSNKLNCIFLKGGDLSNEIKDLKRSFNQKIELNKINLTDIFNEAFFEDKYILNIKDV